MAPYRSLPDAETLSRLLYRAGVTSNGPAGPFAAPSDRISILAAEPSDGPRARAASPASAGAPIAPRAFGETEHGDFSDVIASAPPEEPADSGSLPTIAEMSEADLQASIFGPHLESMPTEERLGAFVQWLMGGTGAFAAFVADTEGLPLTNRNAPESYLAAIGPLGRAQETIARFVPSPEAGSSTVELDHQNVLQVIWSDTAAGRLAVGLVLGGALDQTMVRRIRKITQLSMSIRGEA